MKAPASRTGSEAHAVPVFHRSVLEREVADLLVRDADAAYLDATLGGGGHARAILARLGPEGVLIGLDRDPEAVAHCRKLLGNDPRARLLLSPFSRLGDFCAPASLHGALFDLGVSSRQLDSRERGFSFAPGTPLDMRMGPDAGISALDWLRAASEEEMAECFRRHADLERPRALARRIRELLPDSGSADSDLLLQAVSEVYGRGRDPLRTLARVFQAVRMRVNRELPEIRAGLSAAVTALARGGRLCVLSYHSAEDREVKETIREFERDCRCPPEWPVCRCGGGHRALRKVLRKPMEPGAAEVAANPRARSARLRVLERL
jgi:16S rRNA (cytosine1402-N4)-methyltransferase